MNAVRSSCSACGSEVEVGATFCPRCGAALRSAPPASGPAPTVGVGVPGAGHAPVAVSGAARGRPVPWVTGPEWAASAVLASPGARLGAWLIEGVIFGVAYGVGLVVALPLALALASLGSAGFLVGLFLPSLVILAAALGVIVWEGRTGKRPGTAMLGLRTVEIRTGRPPGFGRALGRTLLLGAIGAAIILVEDVIGSRGTPLPTGVTLLALVLVVAAPAVMILSCGWDTGRLRQGWHEKASGTTTIRLVRAVPVTYAYAPSAAGTVPGAAQQVVAPVAAPDETPQQPVVAPRYDAPVAPAPQYPAPQYPAPVSPVASVVAPSASNPPAPASAGGLIADVPGFAPSPTPMPVHVAPVVPSRPASPSASPPDDEDIEHTRVGVRSLAPAGPARLVFDTGEVVSATRSGLVGRAPLGEQGELLVPIADPDRSISKTHLSFEPDPDGLWVVDLGSTNGTEVERPAVAPATAAPGERVHVPFGGAVRFGTRSFVVERG